MIVVSSRGPARKSTLSAAKAAKNKQTNKKLFFLNNNFVLKIGRAIGEMKSNRQERLKLNKGYSHGSERNMQ